jgi:predicted esterase
MFAKRLVIVLLISVLTLPVLAVTPLASAQQGSTPLEGHTIEGDNVTFVFDQALYELDEIEAVAVKGNFNDSNEETPGWQLSDEDGDGVWTLDVPLGERIKAGTPFRFVADGVVLEPPDGVAPDFLVSDSEGGNLLVIGGLESFLANDPIASQLERRTFVDADGRELNYYLLAPKDYDDTQRYPLVLSLHGAGERGDNPAPILPYNGAYEFMETAADYTYFMLTPQLPENRFWWEPAFKQALVALVAATQEEYPIDSARIYIAGLSLGGYGLWGLVSETPDTFAAGISISGGSPGPINASKIAHIPFWLFHGTDDPVVPVSESQKLAAALEKAGGTVKYTEYEGAQHWIWVRTYTNPEVIDWLFSQVKS